MKAVIVRPGDLTPAKAQSTPSSEGKTNNLENIVYYYSPIFAALASLREIFRVLLVALPR
jgi:hypothetical protein